MTQVQLQTIALDELDANTGQISGLPANPRDWTDRELRNLARSMRETPLLTQARGAVVIRHNGRYVILGGNMRRAAAEHLGWTEMPCIVIPEATPAKELKAIVLKDNSTFGKFRVDMLKADWGEFEFQDMGIRLQGIEVNFGEDDDDEIERKRQEFEERMKAGEISEEDEEYQEFLEKFKLKKTTDDCYTPAVVYDAVADYVANTYGLNRVDFIRPFYPGGDFEKEIYPEGCVVVDNPPFSILSEIVKYYKSRAIRFFLFAPNLTILNYAGTCAIGVGATVTYENGANVQTSFITNLEPAGIWAKAAPELFIKVDEANRANLAATKRTLPKYEYPPYVLTAFILTQFAKYGVSFYVRDSESQIIRELDSQKAHGKGIYGTALLLSEAKKAEMEAKKAEMEAKKAEMEAKKAEMEAKKEKYTWELSERERELIAKMSKTIKTPTP